MALPRWMMLGTEVADAEVPAAGEEAQPKMQGPTAVLDVPQLQAHPEDVDSESMPPVARRWLPPFNDTQNISQAAPSQGGSELSPSAHSKL